MENGSSDTANLRPLIQQDNLFPKVTNGILTIKPTVCLISTGVPATNPRLVKEARALAEAGIEVHCVISSVPSVYRSFGTELLRHPSIHVTEVPMPSRLVYKCLRLRQMVFQHVGVLRTSSYAICSAIHPMTERFIHVTKSILADLYIGHTAAALPVAVISARVNSSLAGFDAEDFHSAETTHELSNRTCRWTEDCYLPQCDYITAASPLIASTYSNRYGVEVETILNLFPTSMSPAQPRHRRVKEPLRLYWFSQTIGPGRGLEELMAGISLAHADCVLSLRGNISAGYADILKKLALKYQIAPPQFLPPAHPDDMAILAAEHDVGLSLEQSLPRNRDLCLTNKLFCYLTAGIPQLVSQTTAQSSLNQQLGNAGRLIQLENPETIASAIDDLAPTENWIQAAKHATELGASIFSWEHESQKLTSKVMSLLEKAHSNQQTSPLAK